jgi:hypothetical protein
MKCGYNSPCNNLENSQSEQFPQNYYKWAVHNLVGKQFQIRLVTVIKDEVFMYSVCFIISLSMAAVVGYTSRCRLSVIKLPCSGKRHKKHPVH